MLRNPNAQRPFHKEEERRKNVRREAEKAWRRDNRRRNSTTKAADSEDNAGRDEEYTPTEGGKDRLICDVGYYARRVGLDIEEFNVQTEDGFILTLWHVFNPSEYTPASAEVRGYRKPEVFTEADGKSAGSSEVQFKDGRRRYPVLLIHGLLQSAGAYCTNDDDSLAFFLCKRYLIFCVSHTDIRKLTLLVDTMFIWEIIAVVSSPNIHYSNLQTRGCGHGTYGRWAY
jgi:hypothetical protein